MLQTFLKSLKGLQYPNEQHLASMCLENADLYLLLEGRQMKLVLEYMVNPISESIAHGKMISVIFT